MISEGELLISQGNPEKLQQLEAENKKLAINSTKA